MKKIIFRIIKIYQRTISPDHGPLFGGSSLRCRFYPSCSQYAYEVIEKYGVFDGVIRSFKRFFRCTPFSKGGVDLV